jgi:hypothetical protein
MKLVHAFSRCIVYDLHVVNGLIFVPIVCGAGSFVVDNTSRFPLGMWFLATLSLSNLVQSIVIW